MCNNPQGPPPGLKCTLLPHQVQGVHWLRDREKGKKRGGLLCDDMGLGKTIQMSAPGGLAIAFRPTGHC